MGSRERPTLNIWQWKRQNLDDRNKVYSCLWKEDEFFMPQKGVDEHHLIPQTFLRCTSHPILLLPHKDQECNEFTQSLTEHHVNNGWIRERASNQWWGGRTWCDPGIDLFNELHLIHRRLTQTCRWLNPTLVWKRLDSRLDSLSGKTSSKWQATVC